jgi:biopolymer transport protein TolQ
MFASSPILNAYFQSDIFGKFIFLSLFTLSITSWVIFLHKIRLSRKLNSLNLIFSKTIDSNIDNLLNINTAAKDLSCPYLDIYKILKEKALEILNKNRFFIDEKQKVAMSGSDIELIDSHLDAEISKQIKLLEKNLFILPTVVTLGPFLGLLGTVWGILLTFNSLQTHSILTGNATILSGLSMALATTIIGLIVAIPALVAHNYLRNWLKNSRSEMEMFSQNLLANLELHYRNVDIK